MKALNVIGKIIFAITFLVLGTEHFLNASKMQGYVPSFIPGGIIWIYITGGGMIAAAVCIMTSWLGRTASLMLALMLLSFIATIHIPGMMNPDMQQMAFMNLLKDAGLMGGAIVIAGSFAAARRHKEELAERERTMDVFGRVA